MFTSFPDIYMLRSIFSSLLITCFCMQLSAQQFEYKPLQSSGELPEALFVSSTSKFESDVKEIKTNQEGLSTEEQEKFHLHNNFKIDALLRSGKVLFNDPIGLYINEVVDEILKDDLKLREKLQFFVVKSPFPNAFTTNDGIILVNAGLINRLETEAQLAFILCHEIAHYQAKHIIKGYALSVALESKSSLKDKEALSDFDKIILKNNYSQENERMADSLGFVLFGKTGYSPETLPAVFDILNVAHEPYMFPKDPFAFIQNPYWHPDFTPPVNEADVKSSAYVTVENEKDSTKDKKGDPKGIEELRPIQLPKAEIKIKSPEIKVPQVTQDEDDIATKIKEQQENVVEQEKEEEKQQEEAEAVAEILFATHPSPMERKTRLLNQLIKAGYEGEALFIVSQDNFQKCKKLAAYELCRIFLLNAGYYDALYQAVSLLEDSPDDPYLNQVVVKALYGIAKYRNKGNSLFAFIDYENQPERLNHFTRCFSKTQFEKHEYVLLALCRAKYHMDRFPVQKSTLKYIEDLMLELMGSIPNFGKMERITRLKYAKYEPVFQELLADSLLQACYQEAKKENERKEYIENLQNSWDGRDEIEKYRKRKAIKGYRLGLDTVLVFSPLYYSLEVKRKAKMAFVESEKEQVKLTQYIETAAKKLKLSVIQLDGKNMEKGTDPDVFNDIMLTGEWYKDFTQHEDQLLISMVYDEMDSLCQKYGTHHFMNLGTINVKESPLINGIAGGSIIVVTVGYTIPLGIYLALMRRVQSMTYAITIDIEQNEVVAYQYQELRDLNKGTRLKAFTYFYLWQLKKKSRK